MITMKYLTELLEGPTETFDTLGFVYHYRRPENVTKNYAVWQEQNDDSFNADNRKSERALQGTLEYFAAKPDGNLDLLEKAMESFGASWSLSAVQFEPDTNLIHYSWDWSYS